MDRPMRQRNGIDREAPIDKVLEQELQEIDSRRQRLGQQGPPLDQVSPPPALEKARERRLVGLSFSGGGIRSASFNLGVLQGLAGLELLRFVDYLSTVSGGGYIGGRLCV